LQEFAVDHLGVKFVSVVNDEADVVFFYVVSVVSCYHGEFRRFEIEQSLQCVWLKRWKSVF
jgi:hypothetical protein